MKVSTSHRNKGALDPKNFPYSDITFVCKHYGKPRIRGVNERPRQSYFASGCNVKLRLVYVEAMNNYKVTVLSTEHNHPISSQAFGWYPENRRLEDSELKQVEDLLQLNVDIRNIKNFVSEKTGKTVISKDIHNIKKNLDNKMSKGRSEGQKVVDRLLKLQQDDPNATTVVEMSSDDEFELLFFQTSNMKLLYNQYPDVLFIDGTYKVNIEGYPLYAFLIEDGEGKGRAVGYAFVKNEKKDTIHKLFDHVGAKNDLNKVKIVFLDKDFTEISAVKRSMQNAHIMLCTFHVLKYLKKKVSDLDIRKNLKSDIMKAISSLVYSYSEEIYRERLTELLKLSPKSFSSYFTDNWDSCREMWAHCYRKSLPTLGNNTNNRVESHNQKLKHIWDGHVI
ncbi:zinc finger SWIM domain-containing protein 3-like [Ptychodera flava]|uniref:zinc finger SWIM domain-containing protein 3-like n=1 Tax=Ptychodera flava TaxID=63121 RepID=UPI00396A67D3